MNTLNHTIPRTALQKAVGILCIIVIMSGLYAHRGVCAQQAQHKEIIIAVRENTIAVTAGEAAKLPISAVRIRSSLLRQLFEKYNAVSIEKLYQTAARQTSYAPATSTSNVLVSKEANAGQDVDVSRLFTSEAKKAAVAEGARVAEAGGIFLVHLEPPENIDMRTVISEYQELDVVMYAEEIVRDR